MRWSDAFLVVLPFENVIRFGQWTINLRKILMRNANEKNISWNFGWDLLLKSANVKIEYVLLIYVSIWRSSTLMTMRQWTMVSMTMTTMTTITLLSPKFVQSFVDSGICVSDICSINVFFFPPQPFSSTPFVLSMLSLQQFNRLHT